MSVKFNGVASTMRAAQQELARFEKQCIAEMSNAGSILLEALFSRTPVWEGQVLRSYTVSAGSAVTTSREPVGSGDPGPTNTMSLGSEPRRDDNESAVRSEASAALSMKTLGSIFITNGSDLWDLVDSGGAPGGPAQRIRNPGGTSKLALQSVRSQLGNFR